MSVLESVLSAVRGKRREKLQSSGQQYDKLLASLASGKQVDVDEVATLLDELDKSDSDLQKDVEAKQRRFVLAGMLDDSRSLAESIKTLEAKYETAKNDLQKATAKLQPAVEKSWNELDAARQQQIQYSNVEAELIGSVMDPQLIEQSNSLDARRKKVGMELYALQDTVANWQRKISYAKAIVEQVASENSKMPLAFGADRQQIRDKFKDHNLQSAKQQLASEERAAKPIFEKFDSLKQELQQLDNEQLEMNKRKLVP